MTIYPNLIIEALKNVRYPGTGKDIVSMGLVEDNIRIDGMNVTFSLLFEKPNDPFIRSVVKAAETAILTYVSPEVNIKGNITVKARQLARPEPDKLLPQVKNIIAVLPTPPLSPYLPVKEELVKVPLPLIWLSHWLYKDIR